ncbi:hypothetical protein [Breoghania sp.]|uniref:hypothetical protein n=1 Tax=Breoghania sp. TaxID=2065378 RepID=UPI00262BA270|nr:hypothetical protein [Breoghania sp.]MDJ0933593.1 hypothetical protein [Breoghania sp.]
MTYDLRSPSDVAFTPAVKAIQSAKGSRPIYARMEERHPWPTRITPDLARFAAISSGDSLARLAPR